MLGKGAYLSLCLLSNFIVGVCSFHACLSQLQYMKVYPDRVWDLIICAEQAFRGRHLLRRACKQDTGVRSRDSDQ